MPWLTPDSEPASFERRVFVIPVEKDWQAVLLGALLPLTYPENWEQSIGGITPDEAAAAWQSVFDDFLDAEICPDP